MRTTITLPDQLVKDLLHLAHTQKPTEAVIIALEQWVKFKKIEQLKNLRGKLVIDDNLKDLRKKDIKKIRGLND